DLHFDTQMEILEVAECMEKMAASPLTYEDAILYFPVAGLGRMRMPALQVSAVEELHPSAIMVICWVRGNIDGFQPYRQYVSAPEMNDAPVIRHGLCAVFNKDQVRILNNKLFNMLA